MIKQINRKVGNMMEQKQYVCPKCGNSMNTINFRRRAAILRKYLMCRIKSSLQSPAQSAAIPSFIRAEAARAGMCLISCLAADRRKDRKQKGDACFSAASPSDGVVFMLEISPRKRCPCPARFPPGSCRRALARSSAPLQGPARRCLPAHRCGKSRHGRNGRKSD